jgi:tetratricopeptide (TPR) repeat protein
LKPERLDSRIQLLRAESLFYLEEYEEAEPLFEFIEKEYLRFDEQLPGHAMKELKYRCYLKLGQISIWKDDLDGAEGHLLRAKEENSDDYKVFKYLGELHSRRGNLSRAEGFFEDALQIMGEDMEVEEELMICKYKLKRFEDVINMGEDLIAKAEVQEDGRNLRVEKYWIMAMLQLHQESEALGALNRVYIDNEADLEFNILKGYVFMRLERQTESQRYLTLAEKILEDSEYSAIEATEFLTALRKGIQTLERVSLGVGVKRNFKTTHTDNTDNLSDISK